MFSLLLGLVRLGQSVARSFREPQFRALLVLYVGAGVFVVLAAELAIGVIRLRDVRDSNQTEHGKASGSSPANPRSEEPSSTTKMSP